MERIFPLPRPIQHTLIDKYCPESARPAVKEDDANKDCLNLPCLGRLKLGTGGRIFSLRNFKLHANQIKDLGLNAEELYEAMAHALAVLHWHTKIDGMDVEFVLGSSPAEQQKVRTEIDPERIASLPPQTSTYEEVTRTSTDFTKRITALWMIDFDDCSDIPMDSSGVDMAVKEFADANFYCPKPNTGEVFIEVFWRSFADRYIHHSEQILENILQTPHLNHLQREFIRKIGETAARRLGSRGTHYIPTGASSSSLRPGSRSRNQGTRGSEAESSGGSQSQSSYGGSWRRGGRGGRSSYRSGGSWRSTSGTDSF